MPQGVGGRRGNAACRWCFTLNNWTEEEYGNMLTSTKNIVKYLIIGKEVGESGTPHLQGFANFKKKLRLGTLKKLSGFTRVHAEIAKGTDLENQRYCRKGNQYLEIGSPQRQGKKSELTEAVTFLKENNGDLGGVAAQYPEVFVRHGRGLRDYVTTAQLVKPREWKTEVFVIIGEPGCGKTRYVRSECKEKTTYWKPRGPWWDGYVGQQVVVLDDFYGWICFDELLRICDRYPLKVPVKGAYVEFVAREVYITSNKPPEEWYDRENIRGCIEAFFRRITE